DPPPVRLAGDRPGGAGQPGRVGTRAPARGDVGETPVLDPSEARALLDSIDTSTVVGLRDRALIGLMVYSFARIGAALGMAVEDVFTQDRRLWVRLREKGGKRVITTSRNISPPISTAPACSAIPRGRCSARSAAAPASSPARCCRRRTRNAMIRRRAAAAGIATKLGNHSFRATGITAYLKSGGTLEKAAAMANHASTRTTQLVDRI